jgi:L-aspartate oxidase
MWLDTTAIPRFSERFPTIWGLVRSVGLDPTHDFLPVAPAAHYLSGGIVADLDGASTLPGLWSCGEAACSGVHGANRLASNSLLDGLVFGSRLVEAIAAGKDGPDATGVMRGVPAWTPVAVAAPDTGGSTPRPAFQRVLTRDAGVLRDHDRLTRATAELASMRAATLEDANLLTVGRALVAAALARRESRGTHTRLDHPERSSAFDGRLVFGAGAVPVLVPLPAPEAVNP